MSQDALSHAEFAAHIRANGGASRSIPEGRKGPEHGYYVSRDRSEGHELVTKGEATAVQAAHHWNATIKQRGEKGGPDVYQGGWHDEDDNKTYWDVSERVNSFHDAVARGLHRDQKSIHDANKRPTGATVWLNPSANNRPETATSTHAPTGTGTYRVTTKGYA